MVGGKWEKEKEKGRKHRPYHSLQMPWSFVKTGDFHEILIFSLVPAKQRSSRGLAMTIPF